MITTEQRQHPRIKCRIIIERLGPTVDLSAGGVRVLTTSPPAEGSEVRLAFLLPESEDAVQCHGSVRHVSPSPIDKDLFEVGVEYQRMMTRNREAIEAYVRERLDSNGDE